MDIDDGDEKLIDRMRTTARDEFKKLQRKEETKQRKKSGASSKAQLRKADNGRSTNVQSRNRSRSPSNRQSDGSPTNSTKQKQRSKKRHQPRSILKANVRWRENYSEEETSDEE